MNAMVRVRYRWLAILGGFVILIAAFGQSPNDQIGREVAIPVHLQDGKEFTVS